jgi:hypothetical protein
MITKACSWNLQAAALMVEKALELKPDSLSVLCD